jgi:hypothetical protein
MSQHPTENPEEREDQRFGGVFTTPLDGSFSVGDLVGLNEQGQATVMPLTVTNSETVPPIINTGSSQPLPITFSPEMWKAVEEVVDRRLSVLIDLFHVDQEELPLIRAVLQGDVTARLALADLCEERGQQQRADRIRHPLVEVKS